MIKRKLKKIVVFIVTAVMLFAVVGFTACNIFTIPPDTDLMRQIEQLQQEIYELRNGTSSLSDAGFLIRLEKIERQLEDLLNQNQDLLNKIKRLQWELEVLRTGPRGYSECGRFSLEILFFSSRQLNLCCNNFTIISIEVILKNLTNNSYYITVAEKGIPLFRLIHPSPDSLIYLDSYQQLPKIDEQFDPSYPGPWTIKLISYGGRFDFNLPVNEIKNLNRLRKKTGFYLNYGLYNQELIEFKSNIILLDIQYEEIKKDFILTISAEETTFMQGSSIKFTGELKNISDRDIAVYSFFNFFEFSLNCNLFTPAEWGGAPPPIVVEWDGIGDFPYHIFYEIATRKIVRKSEVLTFSYYIGKCLEIGTHELGVAFFAGYSIRDLLDAHTVQIHSNKIIITIY